MSTATKRGASRRAMRVATVFTGAAATAVTFAPTALAAPGPAPGQGHTALVNGKTRAMGPDRSGSIKSAACNATDTHWLHIQYESLFQRKLCKAFGFRGTKIVSQDMSAECGGNNTGAIFYGTGSLRYGPGNTYRNATHKSISAVEVSFWSGNDKCAWPR